MNALRMSLFKVVMRMESLSFQSSCLLFVIVYKLLDIVCMLLDT